MRFSRPALLAAVVLVLEGVALAVVAFVEFGGLIRGSATSGASGAALAVMTLLAAVALFIFAGGVLRKVSWARSGGIVIQVLTILLALSSLTVTPVLWAFTLGLGIPGIVGLVLLILVARTDGRLDRRTRSESD